MHRLPPWGFITCRIAKISGISTMASTPIPQRQ
jgi:hypothetical protein